MLLAGHITPGSKVLDVGSADGYMGSFLIENKNCEMWGIEPDQDSFSLASNKGYKYLLNKQIEDAVDDEALKREQFDYIIIGDVLEHLLRPEIILKIMKNFLKPEGRLIVSLPNVAHYSIRFALLRGNWNMTESGIMDKTHLHFYTLKTAGELLENNGWLVENTRPRGDLERWFRRLGLEKIGRVILFFWPEFFAIQFVFKVKAK